VRFKEDSTLLLLFFSAMGRSRKRYKINYINLYVHLPNVGSISQKNLFKKPTPKNKPTARLPSGQKARRRK
jgi:hypothetical protein